MKKHLLLDFIILHDKNIRYYQTHLGKKCLPYLSTTVAECVSNNSITVVALYSKRKKYDIMKWKRLSCFNSNS